MSQPTAPRTILASADHIVAKNLPPIGCEYAARRRARSPNLAETWTEGLDAGPALGRQRSGPREVVRTGI
jgi:hypothetical protein